MNTITMRRMLGVVLIGLALGAAPASALADRPNPPGDRPANGPPPQRGPGGERPGRGPREDVPATPEELRERIERRLEMVRGEEARLQRALQQLDDGAPPEEVFQSLRPGSGPGFGDGPRGPRTERTPDGPGPEGAPFGADGADVPAEYRPEMEPRVMRLLQDRDPEMFRRLREMRDRNPERFNTIIRERWPKIREKLLWHMHEHDAQAGNRDQIRESDRRARELASQASAATGEERERILGELRTTLNAQFDLHAENARSEIAVLQDRIASLTERLEDTLANRAQEIEDRIARLLEEKPRTAPEGDVAPPPPTDVPPEPSDH